MQDDKIYRGLVLALLDTWQHHNKRQREMIEQTQTLLDRLLSRLAGDDKEQDEHRLGDRL